MCQKSLSLNNLSQFSLDIFLQHTITILICSIHCLYLSLQDHLVLVKHIRWPKPLSNFYCSLILVSWYAHIQTGECVYVHILGLMWYSTVKIKRYSSTYESRIISLFRHFQGACDHHLHGNIRLRWMLKIMLQHRPEPNSIIQMTHHISSKHRNILMILHEVITWNMIILATSNVEA